MSITAPPGAVYIPARLDARQAAVLLSQHPESVKRSVRQGRIRGGRVGNRVFIDGHNVAELLRAAGIACVVEDVSLGERVSA